MRFGTYLVLSLALFLYACGGGAGIKTIRVNKPVSLKFVAGKNINNGAILPVDIIAVKDIDDLISIGPDAWFGHAKRDKVPETQLSIMSVTNMESRLVEVRLDSDVNRIVIFSDHDELKGSDGQQIIIEPDFWHSHFTIRIDENGMEIVK